MLQGGDNASALSIYETLDDRGENVIVLNNLAWLYHLDSDERAEETARKAYEIANTDPNVVDTLGWILVKQGDLEQGIDVFETAVQRNVQSKVMLEHFVEALTEAGNTARAAEISERLENLQG